MLLNPASISMERLHFVKDENMLVAEISDFGKNWNFERVWDDACDEGMTIVSHHTGKKVVYAVDHIERDRENDLLYWDLKPADRVDSHLPTVRIFND